MTVYSAALYKYCIVLLIVQLCAPARATILATSQLEKCGQQSTVCPSSFNNFIYPLPNRQYASTDKGMKETDVLKTCSEKIVVTLTLAPGQSLETESLEFALSCVSSDGQCPCKCNYAVDPDCTCRDLEDALVLQLTRTAVAATYAMTYVRSVNFYPVEKIQYTNSCKDGALLDSPTCGWYYLDGQKVADSQGFCCSCSSSQVWTETLGSAQERTRAGLNCDFFDNPFLPVFGSPPGSAHCLIYHDLWYDAYEMAESVMDFAINANMTFKSGDNVTTSTLSVGPSNPKRASVDGRLVMTLVGDLAPYEALPVLTSKLLFVPKADSVEEILANSPEKWMLVDKSRVSLDGTECNKVGASFTAFRYQADPCGQMAGSCLNNQLGQLHSQDEERIRNGLDPLHFVSRYLQGGKNSVSVAGGDVRLLLPVSQIQNSIVTVEVAATDVKFTINAAPGKVLSAQVCSLKGVVCDSVAALNSKAYINVDAQNVGLVDADFVIAVDNCTVAVQSMPAQQIAIPSKQVQSATFEGQLTDSRQVYFRVNATETDPLAQSDGTREELDGGDDGHRSCKEKCGSMFALACLYWNDCTSELAGAITIVIVVMMSGCFLIMAIRRGWLWWFLSFLCSSGSSSRHRYSGKRHRARRDSDRGDRRKRRRWQDGHRQTPEDSSEFSDSSAESLDITVTVQEPVQRPHQHKAAKSSPSKVPPVTSQKSPQRRKERQRGQSPRSAAQHASSNAKNGKEGHAANAQGGARQPDMYRRDQRHNMVKQSPYKGKMQHGNDCGQARKPPK